ncbi:MAG: TIGR03619 family F420-dependent LLM class oxidoreductase [Acidobacteria bacterium]|nr:TIGR03619 family F420-dependent LLM class oxidoreductase [Acidobacteriota bacterium]
MVQFGVVLTGFGSMADPDRLRRLARKADQLGFQSLWLYDHVTFPAKIPERYGKIEFTPETPFLDPIATLSFLAAETKQIRLGTGILLAALRHPLLVAKSVATLDGLSGGRAILGVGLGWVAEEFGALGVPFRQRAGRLRETVEILRGIWTSGRLAYAGRYYSFPEMTSYPMPIQVGGPPIWFGAFADPALKRAAELGDGWFGAGGKVEKVTKRLTKMREFAREHGKNNFALGVGCDPGISPEEVEYFRQAGATHLNLTCAGEDTAALEAQLDSAARRLLP